MMGRKEDSKPDDGVWPDDVLPEGAEGLTPTTGNLPTVLRFGMVKNIEQNQALRVMAAREIEQLRTNLEKADEVIRLANFGGESVIPGFDEALADYREIGNG